MYRSLIAIYPIQVMQWLGIGHVLYFKILDIYTAGPFLVTPTDCKIIHVTTAPNCNSALQVETRRY